MEKIAIISDIHGNVTALEAVLQDIERHGITRIFCLGDLVGKGPRDAEAFDCWMQKCEAVITGNWADYISRQHCKRSVTWYKEQMGAERLAALDALPGQLTFYLSGLLVRLVHAHPDSLFHRIYSRALRKEKESMFLPPKLPGKVQINRPSDLVGYGDIHHAYIESSDGKTLFNCGSVGNSLDLITASYAVLEGEYGAQTPAPYGVSFYRVPYDIEKEVKVAKESGMPFLKPYVQELRTAKYGRFEITG